MLQTGFVNMPIFVWTFFPTIIFKNVNLFELLTNVVKTKPLLSLDPFFNFEKAIGLLICFFPFQKVRFSFFAYQLKQCAVFVTGKDEECMQRFGKTLLTVEQFSWFTFHSTVKN